MPNTALVSYNPLRFSSNFLERVLRLSMKSGDKIGDEELHQDYITEAAKNSALSGAIDKYEYLTRK